MGFSLSVREERLGRDEGEFVRRFVRACKSRGRWKRKTKARMTVEHCKIF